MKRIENLEGSPPLPDSIVTSDSPPPPAAFDPSLVFYNSMYDTVKKGKAGKGARKSLAESKLFGDPKTFGSFEDYGIMPSPKAKKSTKARKNAKSTTPKTPKVRKQVSPKTKRSPRKPRVVKDPEALAAARRKKLQVATKSPRKTKKQQQLELLTDYTTQHNETSVVPSSPIASPQPSTPTATETAPVHELASLEQHTTVLEHPPTLSAVATVASNDIDDAEAAYILSSISQRSFHSYNQKNSGYQHYNIPLDQQHHESPSIIYYSQKDAPPIGGSYHKYFDNGSKVLYHVMLDHNYNAETPGGEYLHYEEPTSSCNELPLTHLTDPMSFLYEVAMNAQTPPPMDVAVAPEQPTPQQMHPTVIVSPKSVDITGKVTKKSSMSLPLCQEVPSPSITFCTERSTNYTLKLSDDRHFETPIDNYFQTMPLDSSQKSTTINDTNNNKYETVSAGVAHIQTPTHTITASTTTTSNDDKFNVKKRWLRQVTEETAITPPPTDNHHKAPLKKRRMAREVDAGDVVIDVVNESTVNIENLIPKDVKVDVKEQLVDSIPQIPALEVLRSLISSTPTILPVFVPKIDQPTTSKAAAMPVNTKKPRKTWAYKQNKRTGKLKLTYVKKSTKHVDKVIIKDEVITDVNPLSSDVIVPIVMDLIPPKMEEVESKVEVELIELIPKVEVIPVIDIKEETKPDVVNEDEIVDVVSLSTSETAVATVDEVDTEILIDDIVDTAISEEREIEKYKAEVEKFTNPGDPSLIMKQLEDIDVVSDVDVDVYDDDVEDEHQSNEMEHWDNVQDFLKLNLDKLSKGNAKYCKIHERRALNFPLEGLLEHQDDVDDEEQHPTSSTQSHEPIKHSYSFDERQLSPPAPAQSYQRSISELPNVMYCKPMEIESPAQRMDFINFATRSNGLMNANITTTQVPRIYGGPLSEYYSPLDVPGRTFGGRNSSFSLYPNTPAIGNFVPVTGGLRPMNGFDSYSTLMTSSNFDTKISPTGVGAFDTTRFMLNCLTPTTPSTPTTPIIPQVNCNNSVLSEDPSWVAFSSKMGGYGKVFTKTASSDPRLNPTLVAEAKKEDVPMPKKKVSFSDLFRRSSNLMFTFFFFSYLLINTESASLSLLSQHQQPHHQRHQCQPTMSSPMALHWHMLMIVEIPVSKI